MAVCSSLSSLKETVNVDQFWQLAVCVPYECSYYFVSEFLRNTKLLPVILFSRRIEAFV